MRVVPLVEHLVQSAQVDADEIEKENSSPHSVTGTMFLSQPITKSRRTYSFSAWIAEASSEAESVTTNIGHRMHSCSCHELLLLWRRVGVFLFANQSLCYDCSSRSSSVGGDKSRSC